MANKIKSFLIFINQKNSLNKPPVKVKSINIFVNPNPFPDNLTVSEKENNTTNTGFNDWGYEIKPPDNVQIKQFFNDENSYDEILDIISDNTEITATNTGGIITDLEYNN